MRSIACNGNNANATINASLSRTIPCAVTVRMQVRGHIPLGNQLPCHSDPALAGPGNQYEYEDFTIPANTSTYNPGNTLYYEYGPTEVISVTASNSCGYTISAGGYLE
jgi:hypothetical protein